MKSAKIAGLCLFLLSAGLVTGCGNSAGNDYSGIPSGPRMFPIPEAGGEIALPEVDGFKGRLVFDAGATPGTTIALIPSAQAPVDAPPLLQIDTRDTETSPFYHLRFSVNQPIPLKLLDSVHLEGAIPDDAEQYHADLNELAQGQPRFLQEVPGAHDGSQARFSELTGDTVLQPGNDYMMAFKFTEQKTIPMTLVNNSGVDDAYFFITGRNPNLAANDPRFYRVDERGQLVAMQIEDLNAENFADYAIPFPKNGETFPVPLISAGRIYVSVGAKVKTQLNPGTQPTDPPAFWVAPNGWSNPGEPNYQTLFDWIEFDYKISPDSQLPGMGINKTEVQMVGLPFTISLTGPTHGTQRVGAKPGARSAVINAVRANPAFADLVVEGTATGTNISPIRVVSPDNGIYNTVNNIPNTPRFDVNFYDSYIDEVWNKYKLEDLTMVTSAFGTYLGRVDGDDVMVFTQAGKADIRVRKPSTADVIIGDGRLIEGVGSATTPLEADIVREVGSAMSACFNRSTLLVLTRMTRNYAPEFFDRVADTALFYVDARTNVYSKAIHANSLPTADAPLGAAYGFGFDDNCNQSSFIGDNNAPTGITVTITAF